MDIISIRFVVLAIASIFIYYLLNPKYRIGYLAILSCGFIASLNFLLLPYILFYSLVNYYIGLKLPASRNKKALYRAGIILNLTQLIILRYASFSIDPIFQLFDINIQVSKLSEIIVPIGISYFTLQGIGYIINVKMGWEKPENRFLDFLLYITFFPKFLSGPIERSNHFLPQLKLVQSFNEQQVSEGLRTALFGFFKKVVIANRLAPLVMNTYSDVNAADGFSLWMILICQPIYIYFDFSGYTDIAVGLAKTFGINLLPNFNRPFFSENITSFWKRFHMSLSSWFNDYVFRQISFKYKKWGIYSSTFAVLITFLLFGIWHGGGWTFMILGLLQAVAINYEFFTRKWRLILFSKMPKYFRIWFGRIMTYLFYSVSLVFFFSPDINSAFFYFSKLTKIDNVTLPRLAIEELPLVATISIFVFFMIELIRNDFNDVSNYLESIWLGGKKINILFRWVVYYLIILSLLIFIQVGRLQQFIYFTF